MVSLAALCALAAIATAPAHADRPVRAEKSVGVADLDLESDEGLRRLSTRFLKRFESFCGSAHEATMQYVMTGGGLDKRAACKAQLTLSANASPAVQRAFALALERMN
jgi:UrcA family protein